MGCHPSHWRTHIFQDGYCTTNQSFYRFYSSKPKITKLSQVIIIVHCHKPSLKKTGSASAILGDQPHEADPPGKSPILVATDLASRGLDVKDIKCPPSGRVQRGPQLPNPPLIGYDWILIRGYTTLPWWQKLNMTNSCGIPLTSDYFRKVSERGGMFFFQVRDQLRLPEPDWGQATPDGGWFGARYDLTWDPFTIDSGKKHLNDFWLVMSCVSYLHIILLHVHISRLV
jgi:hypothetical protein